MLRPDRYRARSDWRDRNIAGRVRDACFIRALLDRRDRIILSGQNRRDHRRADETIAAQDDGGSDELQR